jgi:hypothetical protein
MECFGAIEIVRNGREDRLLGSWEFHERMDAEISGTGWVKG